MRIVALIFKIILSILLILMTIALFASYSYLQGFLLLLIIVFLFYWPGFVKKKSKSISYLKYSRITTIVILFVTYFFVSATTSKTSIYRSDNHKKQLLNIYDQKMEDWPMGYEDIYIKTKYGIVHAVFYGNKSKPPILLFHAASMGAHSWAENLPALIKKFCVYAIDNIGEGNKSVLIDALVYPKDGKEVSALYAEIADSLGVYKSSIIAASNGGFIALNYAYYYPDRVETLSLLGPMGLTKLSNNSIFMMAISSMYPFPFIKNKTLKWALGDSDYVLNKYGDWFDCILSSTIPSIAKPTPITKAQKRQIKNPILLFLGTKDPIVGDPDLAAKAANDFPNIQIEIVESGHLIGVEKKEIVNEKLSHFLNQNLSEKIE